MADLCLHTPRADCNQLPPSSDVLHGLCLHTPRADCNLNLCFCTSHVYTLPPHAPCRLQPGSHEGRSGRLCAFASTRPVQIATNGIVISSRCRLTLPPHAPCRLQHVQNNIYERQKTLPPHAPCRLQPRISCTRCGTTFFASTRPVQIATAEMHRIAIYTFFERVLSR